MKPKIKTVFLTGLLLSINTSVTHAIQIEFDYSYDSSGFFASQERRDTMDYVASFYEPFTDNLKAITPDQNNHWTLGFWSPAATYVTLEDEYIPEDTIRIYAGGIHMGANSGALGYAYGADITIDPSSSPEFINSVETRGQLNTVGPNATDFGTWGGLMIFNADMDWNFDQNVDPSKYDFLTTAIHEIGHILGYGEADSWFNKINNDLFYGSNSIASYGEPVPILPNNHAHWGEGVMSTYQGIPQETLMDPSTPRGERQYPTDLDYAGFQDIGWQIAPVPEPSTLAMFGLGLGLLGLRFRKSFK